MTCSNWKAVPIFFQQLEKALAQGYFLAGYFAYELGYAWEKFRNVPQTITPPLAWMAVFDRKYSISQKQFCAILHNPSRRDFPNYWLQTFNPSITYLGYQKKFKAIQELIAAGDTYQVNLTFPLKTRFYGNAGSLFLDLYLEQRVGYAALLRGGGRTILSLSPELFFQRKAEQLLTRPMKGTAPRERIKGQDVASRRALSRSGKEQAENVMIVDLLRNDLGRICTTGSVKVSRLFQIEAFSTVFQMTSTIQGQLRLKTKWRQIFQSLFPSGSVTGAPKIRTMEIISRWEGVPRGVYTGAIGYITPGSEACFNVPIRTLEIQNASRQAHLGIGSGIVADSQARSEWEECLLKARCFTHLAKDYQLLETLRWDPGQGYRYLTLHLERLKKSARVFAIACASKSIAQKLQTYARTAAWQNSRKVRLRLFADGTVQMENSPYRPWSEKAEAFIRVSRKPVHSGNLFLYHKTSNRAEYNQQFSTAQSQGLVEVLFCNEWGAITEGAISNVFIRKTNTWLTPPVTEGLLPGIERAVFIRQHAQQVKEQRLFPKDLLSADEIYICNSVRGFTPVRLVK